MAKQRSLAREACCGLVAGALATWSMNKATTYLYDRQSRAVRLLETKVRHGRTAYEAAVEKAARVAGTVLTKAQRKKYGKAIHWALGAGAGVLYGALRRRVPAAALARGLLFGSAFWLLVDEGAVYGLRLTPGPRAFPWQTHARGLAGHLTFATAADAALRALERI